MSEATPTPVSDAAAIAEMLSDPFYPDEVKWKPQTVSGNRALAVAFIDARLVQDRLDEALGVLNWQDAYEFLPDGNVVCTLKIRIDGEWIAKTDIGGPSEQPDEGDRRKAAVSDALKRAAVKFGVGRYLYRLPLTWCDYDPKARKFTKQPQLPFDALPRSMREELKAKQAARQSPPPEKKAARAPADATLIRTAEGVRPLFAPAPNGAASQEATRGKDSPAATAHIPPDAIDLDRVFPAYAGWDEDDMPGSDVEDSADCDPVMIRWLFALAGSRGFAPAKVLARVAASGPEDVSAGDFRFLAKNFRGLPRKEAARGGKAGAA